TLEVHWLTQQAIVPLGPEGIIHVVALCDASGTQPDLATLKAFHVPAKAGISMNPACWHASQVLDAEVTCLMLTRDSTTAELVAHLDHAGPAVESVLRELPAVYSLRLDR